jgi:hypothetical protein
LHSLCRCDVPLAIGALVFEDLDVHDGIDALSQRNVFINHLAILVSPLLACWHGNAQYIMGVYTVSHATTCRALQALLERKAKRIGWLSHRPRTVITTDITAAWMCVGVAPERSEEVREKFFGILLSHRCELRVPASDKSLERDWPYTLLKDRLWRRR